MQLGNITLPKGAALAPMAGVGDRAFREICAGMGACYAVGEMASSKGMLHRSRKTAELLQIGEEERPAAVQLFGDEPEAMADAARTAMSFTPDAIDINMGCPAPKVAGGGSGCALMRDLPLAGRIIRAVADASGVPVTVKFRKGWDDTSVNAVETALTAEENGAAAVTVHGRTRAQMYAPPVDLEIIRRVKEAVSIPVIGNGGVDSARRAAEMYERTGCDLIMVGQGALGAPWIFREIRAYLERGELLPPPCPEERMDILLRQARLACKYKGEDRAMREMRHHAGWYLRGWHGAAALRRQAGQLRRFEDLEALAKAALEASVPKKAAIDKPAAAAVQ